MREGDPASTLTILRVEQLPKIGTIVHIRLDRFHFHNCDGTVFETNQLHAPFARAALEGSVTRLIAADQKVPNYAEGYADWLAHCGGVYTISVAQMVEVNDTTRRKELAAET